MASLSPRFCLLSSVTRRQSAGGRRRSCACGGHPGSRLRRLVLAGTCDGLRNKYIYSQRCDPIAQLVEHRIPVPKVIGSSPVGITLLANLVLLEFVTHRNFSVLLINIIAGGLTSRNPATLQRFSSNKS